MEGKTNRGLMPSTGFTTASNGSASAGTARRCQKLLVGAYRLNQYADPESFMMQVAAVFSGYSDAVLVRATDPTLRDCIQRTHKWPPSLAELSDALDAAAKAIETEQFIAERERQGFAWVNDPANNRIGFYNAAGQRYGDPQSVRQIAGPTVGPERVQALLVTLKTNKVPAKPVYEPPRDNGHHERVAADIEARRARREAEQATKKEGTYG